MNTIIPLDSPIKRGDTTIDKITLRKPDSGALRGTRLRDLLDMKVDDIITVLPRISDPILTTAEAAAMDPADLLQAGAAITSFLLPRAVKEEASLVEPASLTM